VTATTLIIIIISSSSSSNSISILILSTVTGLFSLVLLLNDDPHRSGFKFQTAILSVSCVTSQLYPSSVANLSNIFLVWLTNFSLNLLSLLRWLQLLQA
jgi:hypothetical protein